MQVRDRLFIGGEWVAPAGSDRIEVVNPATEEVVARVPDGTPADIDRAVAAARTSFDKGPWRRMTLVERSAILDRAASLLQARSDELARLITDENGSTLLFSQLAQVPGPIGVLKYFADLVRRYPLEEQRSDAQGTSVVMREPVGVVAAIFPWNGPMMAAMVKIAPALGAGCSVVLKPPPETPVDAYALGEVFEQAGLPPGVLNIVAAGREVGEHLVRHPGIDKVAFTGSTGAGRRVMSLCSEHMTRVSLELGGKSAAIILDDAALDVTLPALLPMSFMISGQMCVAQTRILVSRSRHDEVVEALCGAIATMPVGDPCDPATFFGPLISSRQRDRVERYISLGKDEGGKVVMGGGRPESLSRGWYVEPTVFVDVESRMQIAQEEIFGPVVAVMAYDDPDQAVEIANDSSYGLAGTVWTADVEEGIEIGRRVRTGTFSVNGAPGAQGTPFGGFKQSGMGREMGPEGLESYLELKSVAIPAT